MIARGFTAQLILAATALVGALWWEAPVELTPWIAVGVAIAVGHLLAGLFSAIFLPRALGYVLGGIAVGPELAGLVSPDQWADSTVWPIMAGAVGLVAGSRLRVRPFGPATVRSLSIALCMAVAGLVTLGLAAGFVLEVRPVHAPLVVAVVGLLLWMPATEVALGALAGEAPDSDDARLLLVTAFAEAVAIVVLFSLLQVEIGQLDAVAGAVGVGLGFGLVAVGLARAVPDSDAARALLVVGGGVLALALDGPVWLAMFVFGLTWANLSGHSEHPTTADGGPDETDLARSFTAAVVAIALAAAASRVDWRIELLPWAALIVAVRICVAHVAHALGGAITRVGGAQRRLGGLAFAGQGVGVIVLAAVAAPSLPADALALVLQVAVLNMVIGPVAAKLALTQVSGREKPIDDPIVRLDDIGLPPVRDDGLASALRDLETAVQGTVLEFRDVLEIPNSEILSDTLQTFKTVVSSGMERVERVAGEPDEDHLAVAALLAEERADVMEWLRGAVEGVVVKTEELDDEAPITRHLTAVERICEGQGDFTVTLEPERLRIAPGDRAVARWLKRGRRLFATARRLFARSGGPQRNVPLADLATFIIATQAGRAFDVASNGIAVQRMDVLRKFRLLIDLFDTVTRRLEAIAHEDDGLDPETVRAARAELLEECDVVEREIRFAGDQVLSRLGRRLGELVGECGHAALLSGTWELPARRYRRVRALELRARLRGDLVAHRQQWRGLARATAAALALRLDGSLFVDRFRGFLLSCAATLNDQVIGLLEVYPEEVAIQCEQSRERLGQVFADDAGQTDSQLDSLRGQHVLLDGFIKRIAIGELSAALDPQVVRAPFDALFESIERELSDLPEVFLTYAAPWERLGPAAAPPDFLEEEFPFRSLVREVLEDEVRIGLHERQKAVLNFLRESVAALNEVAHYLSITFEAAETELADAGKPPDPVAAREAILTGLTETAERARRVVVLSTEKQAWVIEEMGRLAEEQSGLLIDVLNRVDIGEARRRSGLPEVAVRSLEADDEDAGRKATGWRVVLDRALQPVRSVESRIRSAVGLQALDRVRIEELTAVASFERFEHLGIGANYRRLFETAAFGVEDILAGQEHELAQVGAAVRRWRDGHPNAVLVVGERGAGRTTLIERASRNYLGDYPIHRRRLADRVTSAEQLGLALNELLFGDDETSLERLAGRIADRGDRAVVVVEDLHYLMLRTPAGLAPLELFLEFISRADPHILWIVTVDSAAWRFLDTLFGAGDAFTQVVELGPLSRDETEQLVRRRHAVSGLELTFRLAAPGDSSSHFSRLSQDAAQDRYFDALYRVAKGHPIMTMFHWLSSIVEAQEDGPVVVSWPPRDVSHWVEHLDAPRMFELASVMLHGSMTSAEFAAVLRIDADKATARIGQLCSLNLLAPVPGRAERYALNSLLYKPLFDALRERNML